MPAAADARYRRPARDSKLRRLIIRPGAIGDCVVSLPAMEFLRTDYTEVWTTSRNVPLIRFADRVRSIASTGLDLVGITDPPLASFCNFDEIVSWYGANRPEFREAVAGLPFRFHAAVPDCSCHAVDFYMRQVGGTDGAIPAIPCERRDEGFIAIHPFSGSPAKNWPVENYRALAKELPLPVRVCVRPDQDFEGAVKLEALYEVAKWLAGARLYIGNDSGITHLAAAAGVPTIALFGPTDPRVWAPRSCAPVRVIHGTPLEHLTVATVRAAMLATLGN